MWKSIVLLLLAHTCWCRASDENIDILRCCREGEDLDRATVRHDNRCIPSSNPFRPQVYSSDHEIYTDLPESWIIHEAKWPECRVMHEVKYVPYRDGARLLETGDFEIDGELFDPSDYCLGTRAVLICKKKVVRGVQALPPASALLKPSIKKCCAGDMVYNGTCCVESPAYPDVNEDLRFYLNANKNFNINDVDIITGFAECGLYETTVGEVKDFTLLPDGTIYSGNYRVPSNEFCIERSRVFFCLKFPPERELHQPQNGDTRIGCSIYNLIFYLSVFYFLRSPYSL